MDNHPECCVPMAGKTSRAGHHWLQFPSTNLDTAVGLFIHEAEVSE